jgi:acetyl-CoA carboxylase biotin carboxylase subunit
VLRVLVANRGEIAARIVRACFDERLECVVAASVVDRDSAAARLADRVVVVGPAPAADSYLSVDRMLAAAKASGCDALHPGYGFLSERPELAEACEQEGVTFVGPPAAVMRRAGDKMTAKEVAASVGIPTGGGSSAIETVDAALEAAAAVGYPVILKATAGGGGRGMAVIEDGDALRTRFQPARAEAQQAFGDGRLYVERYVARARHVEVQILADAHGTVVHLGDRDCSSQRRYQKLIEEAPAADVDRALIERVRAAAVTLARALDYVGAGTVEFLLDVERDDFVFLEVNARVQVEHPVTEVVTGIDVVRAQLRIAAGEPLPFAQEDVRIAGHAIECRINAEDPYRGFVPTPGTLTRWIVPNGTGVRVDTHCREGMTVPPYYDSLLAKVIAQGDTRAEAIALMVRALGRFDVEGVATTAPLLKAVCEDPQFAAGPITTRWLEEHFLPVWTKEVAAA